MSCWLPTATLAETHLIKELSRLGGESQEDASHKLQKWPFNIFNFNLGNEQPFRKRWRDCKKTQEV
eukprot:6084082-Amphidinium_carterae.1